MAAAMEATQNPRSEARLAVIVLAAGLSRRMGATNKLLLPFAGQPLVRRVVSTLASLPFQSVFVVTGHEADAVEGALAGLPVRFVRNARYAQGQMTSVRAGLEALDASGPGPEGVLIALSDQPALTAEDLTRIAGAFFDLGRPPVLVPTHRGARGNPIVLARRSLEGILARDANFGCRQFVANNADLVTTIEMRDDHVVVDVDRPEDYARLSCS